MNINTYFILEFNPGKPGHGLELDLKIEKSGNLKIIYLNYWFNDL